MLHLGTFLTPLLALGWATAALPDCGGKPRTFELTLTWAKYAPDGFSRDMILVNGQFPGPKLEMNLDDDVEILVHNKMEQNTTIHYHGVEMALTPWSDGVPGLSQRQIQPGSSFTYKWKATQAGSYWYHAHERGQLDDGLYGPIVIHPKAGAQKPFGLISSDPTAIKAMEMAEQSVQPLLLSDFRHINWREGWDIELASGIETPCYDSFLFNGNGRVDCLPAEKMASLLTPSQQMFLQLANLTALTPKGCLPAEAITLLAAGLPTNISVIPPGIFDVCNSTTGSKEVIEVEKSAGSVDTWVALDIVATFGLMTAAFSIDEIPMYIYAVDGEYIEPQLVDAIVATNGDRYSVLLKLNKPGDYAIRLASVADAQILTGSAVLHFVNTKSPPPPSNPPSVPFIDEVGKNTTASVRFFSQADMKSFPPDAISPVADQTVKLSIRVAGQSFNWALNDAIYPQSLDDATPLLFAPPKVEVNNNVTINTRNGTWVDVVFQDVTFPMPPHPIHKHGNKMWRIGAGEGTFNWSSVAEAAKELPGSFNLVNPPKRDGFATLPAMTGPVWMVIRYHVTNPGAWFMHCHIQSHLLGGMSVVIQDGVDAWPTVPEEYLNYH